ncbi:MAG: adenosylmethionine--8-amino-7-oxononanoate transaminase [Leptospirales bacterium]|nr:adenosylmethionine--8-amino-7-oxononanoate transaminase [Leptospirales bacterium]
MSEISHAQILNWHANHAWQPFTQMKLAPDPEVIASAEGVYLKTLDGRTIIDGVGSWWVSIHGHNHPHIMEAIRNQTYSLDQVMYAGFTHEPAARLSHRLAHSTGYALPRVFFSDNGACAVEIALKMAFQYFANQGRPEKSRFVTLDRGYHGDTIGTMAAGARSAFHKVYEPLLFSVLTSPTPVPDPGSIDHAIRNASVDSCVSSLRNLFETRGKEICGLILEPLIQGADGMNMYPARFLAEVRKLCTTYDIFLIADEVFTGFGRTGTFYACESAGIWPDIMPISKGLSAGAVALGATLATERVYEGFLSDTRSHTLFHGHSMTANPIGCAAANASMDLMDAACFDRIASLASEHVTNLARLKADNSCVRRTRSMGSVAAFDLESEKAKSPDFSQKFRERCVAKGLLVRPLGPVVYLCPPYVVSTGELNQIYSILNETIKEFA